MLDLNRLRGDIDIIDSAILDLLQKRGKLVLEVAEYKKKHNLNILDTQREMDHIEFLRKLNKGPYTNEEITKIFYIIFNSSISLQIDNRETGN